MGWGLEAYIPVGYAPTRLWRMRPGQGWSEWVLVELKTYQAGRAVWSV